MMVFWSSNVKADSTLGLHAAMPWPGSDDLKSLDDPPSIFTAPPVKANKLKFNKVYPSSSPAWEQVEAQKTCLDASLLQKAVDLDTQLPSDMMEDDDSKQNWSATLHRHPLPDLRFLLRNEAEIEELYRKL